VPTPKSMPVKPPSGLMHRGRGLLYWWAFALSQQRLWELPLSLFLGVTGWLLLSWGWLSGWPALALTFRLTWGPEVKMPLLSQFQFGPVVEAPTGPPRTIYLLFATRADQQQIWQHIMADWQTMAG
jgi:hypothetical protein